MKRHLKGLVAIFLSMAMIAGFLPLSFATNGGIVTHEVEIHSGGERITSQLSLKESEVLQLNAVLVDCSMPEGGYFVWKSDTPLLVSVDQNGLLRAHDSSKGAILRLWLDNDVRTIPVIGNTTAAAIEMLFDGLDVDTMDAEGILDVVEAGASVLPGNLTNELINKLREKLYEMDTGVSVTLYDGEGQVRASDEIRVLVLKSDDVKANFFPNGTTITNKEQIPSKVEVGYSMQLQAVTTPLRLHMGVTWTLKSGKDFAELTEDGFVSFKKPGTVEIMASPDVRGFMDNVQKYTQYVGNGDPETTAEVVASILHMLGVPISENVMKYPIWGLLAVVGAGNEVKWSETALPTISNYLLQLQTNDKIKVEVLDRIPAESFVISGNTSVVEGESEQLAVSDLLPRGVVANKVLWEIDNTDIITIDPSSGLMYGRDAGSGTGTAYTMVTATLGDVSVSKVVNVKGKSPAETTDIEITGPSIAEIGTMTQMTCKTFPARVVPVVTWGLLADDGLTELYATSTSSAENSIARINKNGFITPLKGGGITVLAKVNESIKDSYKVYVGTLVEGLALEEAPNIAVEVPMSQSYRNASAQLTPVFTPENATNQDIIWSSDSTAVTVDSEGRCSPSRNSASYATITATSLDGGYRASCVVSFANNPATGVNLNKNFLSLHEGNSETLIATVEPEGLPAGGGASIKDVFWTSSDPTVVSVEKGKVVAHKPGNAIVTATSYDNFKTAECIVSVRANKTNLNNMINMIVSANLDPEDYPPEDFAVLETALGDAYAARESEHSTQEECDAAELYLAITYSALNQYIPLQGVALLLEGSPAPDYHTHKIGIAQNYKNQSLQLSHELMPNDADYKSVTWISSNPSVTVDQTGKCSPTENKAAWSVITVRAEDYLGNVLTDSLNLAFAKIPATGISLNQTSVTGALVHDTKQLVATVTPTGTPLIGADIRDLEWYTDNPNVISVNSNGLVTCTGPGTAIAYAKTRDGGFLAACSFEVSLNKLMLAQALSGVEEANLNYLYYTPVSWYELAEAVEEGQMLIDDPHAPQVDIDATTERINTAYENLQTYIYANSISIHYEGEEASDFIHKEVGLGQNYRNQSLDLSARLSPLDSHYMNIQWTSDSSAIEVDQNGVCRPTANKPSWALITVTASLYHERTLSKSVYVAFSHYEPTHIELNPTEINASIGYPSQKINCKVKSQGIGVVWDADIQDVIWSSTNPSAVPVDSSGNLSFLDSGVSTVTATSVDSGVTASCNVTVSGDKTALGEAIAYIDSLNLDPQEYEYTTSTAFTNAYNHALTVYESITFSQEEIDEATADLYASYEALEPYKHMESIKILHNNSPAPSHIPVKVETWQLYQNQRVQLSYTYAPTDSMYTSIVWSSNDPSILVDEMGLCRTRGAAAGGARITLTATDHYGNTLEDHVFVSFANYPVTAINIDKTELNVMVGAEPQQITSSFLPTGALRASVQKTYWSSSDPEVATVDQTGLVTFVEAGECEITATSYDGPFSKTCTVTVLADKTELINAIDAIDSLDPDEALYTPQSWAVFAAAYEHAILVRDTLYSKQSEVDQAKTDLLAAFDALVEYVAVKGVQITHNGELVGNYFTKQVPLANTYQSQSIQLGYVLNPHDATLNYISWASNSSSVSVDENGLCKPTANRASYAKITLTVEDFSGATQSAEINVAFANYPVTGVNVSPANIDNGMVGGSANLTASLTPTGTAGVGSASIKDVSWSSSDPAIATVNSDGRVSFLDAGVVYITATTADGGFTASCLIKIRADKTALLAAIERFADYRQSDHTPDSWAALLVAFDQATSLYADDEASQSDVENSALELNTAYAALKPYIYIKGVSLTADGLVKQGYITVRVDEDYLGTSTNISPAVNPTNAMYESVVYESDSPDISIDQNGLATVNTNSACFATITATLTDHFGNTYQAQAVLSFIKIGVASLTLSPSKLNVPIGHEDIQLEADLQGENGQTPDFNELIWKSDNPQVASVDQNGLVTIGSGGVAYISVTTLTGELTATCMITVTIDKEALADIINEVMQANYQAIDYSPSSFANLQSSLKNARAVYAAPASTQQSVDEAADALASAQRALVKRQKIENIIITLNGSPAPDAHTHEVKLYQAYRSQTVSFGVDVDPINADFVNYQWTSSDPSIDVDQNGNCSPSANRAGSSMITITFTDSLGHQYSDSVFLTFANYPVTGVSLDKSELDLAYGGSSQKLTPTIDPVGLPGGGASASIKTVTWSSSRPDIASVDQDGNVYPLKPGQALITCTTDDGQKTASCLVNVSGPKIEAAPSSDVTVDRDKNLIYGIPEGTVDFSPHLSATAGELVITPTALGYGTGTKIELVLEDQTVETFYLLIFGDANGDGYADAMDAVVAEVAYKYLDEISELQIMALDLNNNGKIDEEDFARLELVGLFLDEIDQSNPYK